MRDPWSAVRTGCANQAGKQIPEGGMSDPHPFPPREVPPLGLWPQQALRQEGRGGRDHQQKILIL